MSEPKRVLELYTMSAAQWRAANNRLELLREQHCAYLGRRCLKMRKSAPDVTIGTCTVNFGGNALVICPYRFLQRKQIFRDVIPLLERHEPGNEIHVVSEVEIPGGNIDYFVASVKEGEIIEYLALEVQALDTTGTVWPARQVFIQANIEPAQEVAVGNYGMNWKMTAKTTLLQLHHKAQTLAGLGKKLVLALQDGLYDYMGREFDTSMLHPASTSDAVQFHVYSLVAQGAGDFALNLSARYSTTPAGIEVMLGSSRNIEISEAELKAKIMPKLSRKTLLSAEFHPQDVPPDIEPRTP